MRDQLVGARMQVGSSAGLLFATLNKGAAVVWTIKRSLWLQSAALSAEEGENRECFGEVEVKICAFDYGVFVSNVVVLPFSSFFFPLMRLWLLF